MSIRNSILILFFSLIAVSLYAQPPYPSRLGRFTADQVKGCAPFTITITDVNGGCGGGAICLMNYEGKGTAQNQFTYTYTTPGTFKLTVLYPSIGQDDIQITVIENTQPPFEMYSCAGNKVSVRVTDNKYEQYLIDFNNDGTPESILPFTNNIVAQHSYPGAGSYNISVRGRNTGSADNCTATIEPFNAIATLPVPAINALTAIDASTLKLNFGKQTDINQRMEIAVNNASTFQLYQSIYEKDTLRATNIKVDDNYYCFRLSAHDPCANTNTYSNIICSQNFDLTIDNAVNNLAWATSTVGLISTEIQRNGTFYTKGTLTNPYPDVDIVCKTDYCYRIISNYPGGVKSTSLEKCGTSFTTTSLPIIDNISAVVTDPGVDLNWLVDPTINKPQYLIFRSIGGSPYQPFGKADDKKFTDGEYTTSGSYCYRVDYIDACGNFSPAGTPTCPIRLSGSLLDNNVVTLSWSKFNGWKDGVNSYMVDRYTITGTLINSINVGTDTTYVEDPPDPKQQTIRYRIRAVAVTTGLTASLSNTIEIAKKTNLYSPTAFTPNQDKLNDTFSVSGYYISKISLMIFDRWGALIYTSDRSEAWNGTRSGSGQPLPEGSYIWKANITDFSGKNFSEEGTVLLIRTSN